jgi:hypothetical protein
MSDRAKKISELSAIAALSGDDLFVVVDDPSGTAVTAKITANSLFNSYSGNVTIANTATLSTNNLIIRRNASPANSTIDVNQGTIFFDSNYIYVAVANNLLKRIELETF